MTGLRLRCVLSEMRCMAKKECPRCEGYGDVIDQDQGRYAVCPVCQGEGEIEVDE